MEIKDLTPTQWPWPLLLDADPCRERVETYIHQATVMGLVEFQADVAREADPKIIAVVVILQRDRQVTEVMNIAVAPAHRGKKLGKRLLGEAIARSRQQGAQQITVGTGNSSLDQLAFYQKMGFRLESVDRDYFVRHYPEPIYENGIWCRDRIVLSLDLQTD